MGEIIVDISGLARLIFLVDSELLMPLHIMSNSPQPSPSLSHHDYTSLRLKRSHMPG